MGHFANCYLLSSAVANHMHGNKNGHSQKRMTEKYKKMVKLLDTYLLKMKYYRQYMVLLCLPIARSDKVSALLLI